MFIFSRLIAYDVKMTTNVPENHYDLGINRQGQIYLYSVLQLIKRTPLSLFDEGCVYIDCFWCVNDGKGFRSPQGQGQIYFKSVFRLVTQIGYRFWCRWFIFCTYSLRCVNNSFGPFIQRSIYLLKCVCNACNANILNASCLHLEH